MRSVIVAASFAALLGMTACDKAKTAAVDTVATPVAQKSMARMVQMYAGQEQISKVDTATILVSAPGTLEMKASGSVDGTGFKNAGFLPRINAASPKNGIYEVDVVADRPTAPGAAAATPIAVNGPWSYPADHLKGVKFISKTNSVVTMLPTS